MASARKTPNGKSPHAGALVAAYREIKGTLELDRQGRCDHEDDEPSGGRASWGVLTPANRVWHWAFG